jgi:DNA-binding CsgD family transcriptional regulator
MAQKATYSEHKSCLTPQQEQAAALLASGKTITDTATDLQISRSTVHRLLQDNLFITYYNLLCQEIKINVKNNLFALQKKAFSAITEAFNSDNDTVRLKAAIWVIENIQSVEIGNTSPVDALRDQCMTDFSYVGLDESEYERLKRHYDL